MISDFRLQIAKIPACGRQVKFDEVRKEPSLAECHLEKNKTRCTCTYEPCDRKGRCCECITYHWKMKELPGCLFSAKGERSYDRSIRRFISENK